MDADIFLFDDVFSVLDPSLAELIFNKTIKKNLTGKCVIVVTSQVSLLPLSEKIMVLRNG